MTAVRQSADGRPSLSLPGLAREAGHQGRLLGLDPGAGMLEQARRRPEPDIEWILGDLESTSREREFDFVVMTGHAFQVLLGDDEPRAAPAAVRAALTADGRFGFETRDPLAREWESWTTSRPSMCRGRARTAPARCGWPVKSVLRMGTSSPSGPASPSPESTPRETATAACGSSTPSGSTCSSPKRGWWSRRGTGDWDRGPLTDASPEIITVARRTPA